MLNLDISDLKGLMKGESSMKSTHKVVRFDYSKYESKDPWDHETLEEFEFWGFHKKSGRIHIDTKRYKKACEKVGITDFLPEGLFKDRNTVYFVPEKVHRYDYKINLFRDMINGLKKEWEEEYRPLFSKIKTPKDVYENVRLGELCYTGCSDDYDEIEIDARMASFKREESYNKIMNELYCMFIQKITTEIDRFTLIFMEECGYKGTDFSFEHFMEFTERLIGQKRSLELFKTLNGYNCYSLLHKINNFLKHNSKDAYKTLLHTYPANVRSVKNGTSTVDYQNGQFAGDWIILKPNYLDSVFGKLIKFFEDYCAVVLKENVEESKWNYDEYFINAYSEMRYPRDYLGIYY